MTELATECNRQPRSRACVAEYVDVTADGTVSAPSWVVRKGRADEILSLLQRELSFCESVVAEATPSQFAAALESMRTSALGQEMRQVVNEGGPAAGVAFAICARGLQTWRKGSRSGRALACFATTPTGLGSRIHLDCVVDPDR